MKKIIVFVMTMFGSLQVRAAEPSSSAAASIQIIYGGTCVVSTFGPDGHFEGAHSKGIQMKDRDKTEIYRNDLAAFTVEVGTSTYNGRPMYVLNLAISDVKTGKVHVKSGTSWAVGGPLPPLVILNENFNVPNQVVCWPN